jgi:hypothetical protein
VKKTELWPGDHAVEYYQSKKSCKDIIDRSEKIVNGEAELAIFFFHSQGKTAL